MVECNVSLDHVFHCLSDPIRRAIIELVRSTEKTMGELARNFTISYAGVAKHLKVMEEAQVIRKRRQGKYFYIQLNLEALCTAEAYLEQFRQMWESRYQRLEKLLEEGEQDG